MRSSAPIHATILLTVAAGAALAGWLVAGSGGADGEAGAPAALAGSDVKRADPDHRLELDAPPGAHPIVWVRAGKRVKVRTEPGGGEVPEVVGRKTEFGSPTVFGVVRTVGEWAAVKVPWLANDQLGWVRLDSRRLRAGWTYTSIVIVLSERRAVLRERGRPVRSFTVTVGAPGTETPTGRFAVTDTFRGGLNPVYGCCAVALSANQPNLPTGWLGGNRIAIHGGDSPLGVAVSSGCVRAADKQVSALVDRVDLGAPVFVRE